MVARPARSPKPAKTRILGSPALPVLRVVVPERDEHMSGTPFLHRSAVIAQAPLAAHSGRAAGPADPALSRPPDHHRLPTPRISRLSRLRRAVLPGPQPVRARL